MLTIEDLHKNYGGRPVLRGVDLAVEPGRILGLLGPNGMGKTTLLNSLVGITLPDRGRVHLDGKDLLKDAGARQVVGYVGERPNYYGGFRVQDLVRLYRQTYAGWSQERYEELSHLFELPAGQRIRSLSRGMKSQLALLVNLSTMPRLLVLDEPTSGLDPVARVECHRRPGGHVGHDGGRLQSPSAGDGANR